MAETLLDSAADTAAVAPTTTDPAPAAAPAVPPAAATPTPAAPAAPAAPTEVKWPETWREELAKGDDKRLQQLQRLSDIHALANKAWSLESKLSSGEFKRAKLPDNATPEQVAEWRKDMGLPEKVEDYKAELPNGVVLSEYDKPTLENFQKFAFESNLPPDVMNKTLAWYFAEQERTNQARELADVSFHDEAKDALMSEWGLKDYRANLAAMSALRDQMPQGLADRILAGRTADGRLVGDDPQFLRWFATLAREMNPAATVIPADSGKTLDGELDNIRKLRRENPDKYDADKALQARERELLEVQIKARGRK